MVDKPNPNGMSHLPEREEEKEPDLEEVLSRSDIFEPRSFLRKKSDRLTTITDKASTVLDAADKASNITGLPEASSILSNLAGSIASFSPIGAAALGTVSIVKTASTQLDVKERLDFTRNLYQESVKTHFPQGLPELPNPDGKTPLSDLLENPKNLAHLDRSPTEAVMHVLEFNIGKLDSRTTKLIVKQLGADTALTGMILAGIGAAAGGIGAIVGAIVSTVGASISSLPEIHALARAIYKIYKGTKGVDRNSAAKFLWGLTLRKGIQEGVWGKDSFSPEAKKAHQLAEDWASTSSDSDMNKAQDLATKLLEGTEVVSLNTLEKSALSQEEFLSKKGHGKIMARLKSTAET